MKPALAVIVALLPLLAAAPPAQARAMEECVKRAKPDDRRDLLDCLEAARRAASEEMLEEFLSVQQALEQGGGRGGAEALKQAQRDFERYRLSHCQLAPLAATEAGQLAPLQIACDAETLWDRAAQLRRLLPPPAKKD